MQRIILSYALILSLSAAPAQAGKFNAAVSVGDAAKPWAGLTGTDDKPHALADLKDAKLVVVVFTCNHCPVAQALEDRLLALARDYGAKGVRFTAVSVSRLEADGLPAMKTRVQEKHYPFPYLHDPSQKLGKAYGARATPTVFVLRRDRTIGYMGTIDDNWNDAGQVKHAYLREALDALLTGRDPETKETRPVGCAIQYEE